VGRHDQGNGKAIIHRLSWALYPKREGRLAIKRLTMEKLLIFQTAILKKSFAEFPFWKKAPNNKVNRLINMKKLRE
jgi:hypothetical protein